MQNQPPQLYGVNEAINEPLSIWHRLASKFSALDFVRVMNIDDETFYWQALNPNEETYEVEGDQFYQQKNTLRGTPKMFSIPAGATAVLEGWNAMIMIEKLYKKICAKKGLANKGDKREVNFSWSNPELQEEYINKIFLGIEKPTFAQNTPVDLSSQQKASVIQADPTVAELAKELGLDEPAKSTS